MNTAKVLNSRSIGMNHRNSPFRVLVVDDEATIRNLISRVLKSLGFEIIGEAENGLEAIDLYMDLLPDIVTMDVMMPEMDGVSALQHIRKRDPEAVVLMITNEADEVTVRRLISSGARDYIVKPLERKIIVEKMANIVRNLKG